MRIEFLLRQRETKRFYAGPGEWVLDIAKALRFKTASEALLIASLLLSAPLEICYSFDDPSFDFAVPISEEWKRGPREQ